MKLLPAAVLLASAAGLAACEVSKSKRDERKDDSYTYRYEMNGCDTGMQTFSSKDAYCKGLADDAKNNFCAEERRAEAGKAAGCPATKAPSPIDEQGGDGSQGGDESRGGEDSSLGADETAYGYRRCITNATTNLSSTGGPVEYALTYLCTPIVEAKLADVAAALARASGSSCPEELPVTVAVGRDCKLKPRTKDAVFSTRAEADAARAADDELCTQGRTANTITFSIGDFICD